MKKWILLLIVAIIVVACGIAFVILSQPPKDKLSEEYKKQAIEKMLGRQANINPVEQKTGDTKFNGKYITFEYPAKAVVYKYQDPNFKANDSRLEDFSFDIKVPHLVFNLQVLLDSSNLSSVSDYPGVRLRDTRSEFKKSDISIGNVKGVTYFNGSKNAEKTGFFLKNSRIYSLSVTGNDAEEVNKLFDAILLSVAFVDGPKQ